MSRLGLILFALLLLAPLGCGHGDHPTSTAPTGNASQPETKPKEPPPNPG